MATSRKKNPGLFRTRKAAVLAAIERAESDPNRVFNPRGTWFVVGGNRRWGVVGIAPAQSMWIGPITTTTAEKYRRWYA